MIQPEPETPAISVKPLIAALADADESVRKAAAEELVRVGGPAVEPLVECLRYETDHKGAGDMACWALGEIGDPRGIRSLIEALDSEGPGVRPAASRALVQIGAPTGDLLIFALKNPNGEIRQGATATLEVIGDPRAVEPLAAFRARWGSAVALTPEAPAQAAAPTPANPVAPAPASAPPEHSVESLMEFLSSQELSSAVEAAKRARDQSSADEWARRGSPGAGLTHSCAMCRTTTYGEETVVEMQQQAVYLHHSPLEAQQIERKSGYRCKSCGREYCKDCLEKKAPSNAYGGKSCPSCNGLFEIIHG